MTHYHPNPFPCSPPPFPWSPPLPWSPPFLFPPRPPPLLPLPFPWSPSLLRSPPFPLSSPPFPWSFPSPFPWSSRHHRNPRRLFDTYHCYPCHVLHRLSPLPLAIFFAALPVVIIFPTLSVVSAASGLQGALVLGPIFGEAYDTVDALPSFHTQWLAAIYWSTGRQVKCQIGAALYTW
ncbi:hypothetical protein B0H11DRAFT_951349 [Mycena galericulata]|nr:hypothetical protein B0H11DRAFT_951349 [Mycena galericulata]